MIGTIIRVGCNNKKDVVIIYVLPFNMNRRMKNNMQSYSLINYKSCLSLIVLLALVGCSKTETSDVPPASEEVVESPDVLPTPESEAPAENSANEPDSTIVKEFGKTAVERFEQMFQNKEYDFSYCSTQHWNNGANILHYAARTGDLNRVQELLDHGADINVKTKNGMSVLRYAVRSGSLELVQWLFELGLDVDEKDRFGYTVIYPAAESGSLELVQWLAELGLDVNANVWGYSVLNPASQSGSLELVQWLVEQGLDVNVKDAEEQTVLHYAAKSGSLELVQWLVEQGLNVNAKDVNGKTVLDYAIDYEKSEIAQWLEERGAKRAKAEN